MVYQDTFSHYIYKFVLLAPLGFLTYFVPLVELALAVGFFILIDTFTGIWACRVEKVPIHSRKTRQIVAKLIAYMTALILGFVFDNHILVSTELWTTRAIAFVLSSIEIQSNLENLYRATGLRLWDRLKHLFKQQDNRNG